MVCFYPTGRLPAHFHDFDESICIISGVATCVVEGRQYQMQDGQTALQPRGRVHYFINNTQGTMEMLWVYAGLNPSVSSSMNVVPRWREIHGSEP